MYAFLLRCTNYIEYIMNKNKTLLIYLVTFFLTRHTLQFLCNSYLLLETKLASDTIYQQTIYPYTPLHNTLHILL